jgi:hypothetical protein
VVSVEFTQEVYVVLEGDGLAAVSVRLTGELEREAVITLLSLNNGSSHTSEAVAATPGLDYQPISVDLTFEQQTVASQAFNISQDFILESNESIVLNIFSIDSAVNITSPTAEVIILDSNGKITKRA